MSLGALTTLKKNDVTNPRMRTTLILKV